MRQKTLAFIQPHDIRIGAHPLPGTCVDAEPITLLELGLRAISEYHCEMT